MKEIIFKIEFLSDWHAGSGLSSGADVDALCVKDEFGFPFVPGKTIKGLLREAAQVMFDDDFINDCFGIEGKKNGYCYFSNGELSKNLKENIDEEGKSLLFRNITSTAIGDNGIAEEHSLRKIEVTVPLTLYAKISDIPDEKYEDCKNKLTNCMKYTKRLGINRNRGLGRCILEEVGNV